MAERAESMTLDELKAQNAADEAAETAHADENDLDEGDLEGSPQELEEKPEDKPAEDETGETEGDADPADEETGESKAEDWMQGDETPAEDTVSNADAAAIRRSIQAKANKKLEAADSELKTARARIAELEGKTSAVKTELVRPKRDDFFEEDDPDLAYELAIEDYLLKKVEAKQAAGSAAENQKAAQAKQAQAVEEGENAHYDRAARLVAESGIKAETYQAADLAFRTAIDSVIPGAGDNIAAAFISKLGEGSEKVVFNLGVNAQRRAEFTQLLREDGTGLQAGMYLAELKATLLTPKNQQTRAPKPAPKMNGDATENSSIKALKKRYKSAATDQERYEIRQKGRQSGVSSDELNTW